MSTPTRTRIGAWIATPALNLLENGAQSLKIEPKTMDVLAYVAARPGEVVSVEELLAAVWRGTVVTDASVYMAIKQLRRALTSSDEGAHYIETIPKRGYRLTARVERLPPMPSATDELIAQPPGDAEQRDAATPSEAPLAAPVRRGAYRTAALAGAAVAVVVLAASAWVLGTGNAAATRGSPVTPSAAGAKDAATVVRFEIPVTGSTSVAVSPDGKYLAYFAADAFIPPTMYVRPLDGLEARPFANISAVGGRPIWSPDSRHIAYGAIENWEWAFLLPRPRFRLERVAREGGAPQVLAENLVMAGDGSWSTDGVIVFDGGSGIERIDASTGSERAQVTRLEPNEGAHGVPNFLPDGRRFLFATAFGTPGVYVQSLDTGERTRILAESATAAYASGYLLFNRGATLLAQRFDPDRLALHGEPIRVADGLRTGSSNVWAPFSVSQTGVLAYVTGGIPSDWMEQYPVSQLTWYDRGGRRLNTVGEPGVYRGIALSPDGKRIAVHRHEQPGGGDLWIVDVDRDAFMRLTFGLEHETQPVWSPDGSAVAYMGKDYDLYEKPSDGVGGEALVLDSLRFALPSDWSRDGSSMFVTHVPLTAHHADLSAVPLRGDRTPVSLESAPFNEVGATLSPDGKWLAYSSDASGHYDIYLRSYPEQSRKWQVSTAGGTAPQWSRDGTELFYLTPGGTLMAVPVDSQGAEPIRGAAQALFRAQFMVGYHFSEIGDIPHMPYAVTPDGQRFLVNERLGEEIPPRLPPSSIVVVVNWTAALDHQGAGL